MCNQTEAIRIMKEVFHDCEKVLPVNDAYLYGSYARGDYRQDSDLDIMLISPLPESDIRKHRREIYDLVGALCLDHDITISVSVRSQEQFKPDALPYYKNVITEGIRYHPVKQ